MSRDDWVKNPVHQILIGAGLWPFRDGEINTVLDVACGLSLKSKYLKPKMILGVDIYEPYLKAIESDVPYAVIKYDVTQIGDICLANSFDVVYAIDILEHLSKDQGIELIKQCKMIAQKAVVVESPNGYVPQDIDIQGFNADEYQTHRSGWSVDELKELGFECITRKYRMQDIKRHSLIDVDPNIELIDGIYKKQTLSPVGYAHRD
jgi:predicted TPR repeat methyltransferase